MIGNSSNNNNKRPSHNNGIHSNSSKKRNGNFCYPCPLLPPHTDRERERQTGRQAHMERERQTNALVGGGREYAKVSENIGVVFMGKRREARVGKRRW